MVRGPTGIQMRTAHELHVCSKKSLQVFSKIKNYTTFKPRKKDKLRGQKCVLRPTRLFKLNYVLAHIIKVLDRYFS